MSIKATIPAGVDAITLSARLHQWDYGQQMEIESPDLTAIVEVHFACAGMTEAIVRPCSTVSGAATVAIPDVCLEQSGPITAWIFEINGAHGTTAKTITIPVLSRPRPAGREEIPEELLDEYQELITAANAAVGDILNGNITVEKARKANSATIADEAQGAPNNGEQGFDDDQDRGRSFTFYNTNGFGIKGGTGHYKLWGQRDEEDGLYYPHIIPSVPSKMVIGHGQSPLKAVVADRFIGTADSANTADSVASIFERNAITYGPVEQPASTFTYRVPANEPRLFIAKLRERDTEKSGYVTFFYAEGDYSYRGNDEIFGRYLAYETDGKGGDNNYLRLLPTGAGAADPYVTMLTWI